MEERIEALATRVKPRVEIPKERGMLADLLAQILNGATASGQDDENQKGVSPYTWKENDPSGESTEWFLGKGGKKIQKSVPRGIETE